VIRFILLCALLLSGCNRMAMLVKPEPVNAQISQECNLPCDPPMDVASDDINEFYAVSKVNRAYLVRCSTRRDACFQAIDRLKQAKVID